MSLLCVVISGSLIVRCTCIFLALASYVALGAGGDAVAACRRPSHSSQSLLYNIQHAKLRKKENYSFSTSLLFSRTGSRGEGVLSLAPHRQHERKRRSRTNPYRFKITKFCDRIFKIMFVVDGFCSLVVA